MVELLLSKTAITVYEVLVILILIIILVRQSRKNKDIQERRTISDAKLRNARLEERLKNPEIVSEVSRQSNPYDVQYVQNTDGRNMSQLQVAIEVHTETSVQRHLFDLDREITIGQAANNDLVLNDMYAPPGGCSVLTRGHDVYVKNQNINPPVRIQRGNRKMLIQSQMVKLQSKDVLTIGNTALHVSLYKN